MKLENMPPLTEEQIALVNRYVRYVYKMVSNKMNQSGFDWRHHKESATDMAIGALMRAVQTYDPDKPSPTGRKANIKTYICCAVIRELNKPEARGGSRYKKQQRQKMTPLSDDMMKMIAVRGDDPAQVAVDNETRGRVAAAMAAIPAAESAAITHAITYELGFEGAAKVLGTYRELIRLRCRAGCYRLRMILSGDDSRDWATYSQYGVHDAARKATMAGNVKKGSNVYGRRKSDVR